MSKNPSNYNSCKNILITDNSIIEDSAFCAMLDNPPGIPLWELSTCLFFVIPMILIFVLYVRMGIQIKQRTTEKLGKLIWIEANYVLVVIFSVILSSFESGWCDFWVCK